MLCNVCIAQSMLLHPCVCDTTVFCFKTVKHITFFTIGLLLSLCVIKNVNWYTFPKPYVRFVRNTTNIHCESKNWTVFQLSITFANNVKIVIILSLLQTKIICPQTRNWNELTSNDSAHRFIYLIPHAESRCAETKISKNTIQILYYTVFQKKFTPRTFMITVWNENQFK